MFKIKPRFGVNLDIYNRLQATLSFQDYNLRMIQFAETDVTNVEFDREHGLPVGDEQ